MDTNRNINLFINTAKYALSIAILFYLAHKNLLSFEAIFHPQISIYIIIIALCLNYIKYFISCFRYSIFLNSQDINVNFKDICIWNLQARFFEALIPTFIGADIIKIYNLNNYLKANNTILEKEENRLFFATIFNLGDKGFALSSLFYISTLSLITLFLNYNTISILYFNEFSIFTLSITLILLIFIYFSTNNTILNFIFIKKVLEIKYLSRLIRTILNIMQKLGTKKSSLAKILIYSTINQIISISIILLLVLFSNSIYIENYTYFILLFFFVIPIAYLSNLFGFFGGFGIGTLGIGYSLVTILNIEDGYNLAFLNQSISFLARFSCAFSCLYLIKSTKKIKF